MKTTATLIFWLLYFSPAGSASAQTYDEWFHQGWTHNQYSVQQVSGLLVFLGKLQEGTDIALRGLTTISNITDGNFNLHRDFFGSLKNVSPAIRKSTKVMDILAFQAYIIRDMGKVYDFCKTNENFSADEIYYIGKVHANLLVLIEANLDELILILSAGETSMTADERLGRIDKIHNELLEQRAFVKAFGSDAQLISMSRQKQRNEIEHDRKIHGTL